MTKNLRLENDEEVERKFWSQALEWRRFEGDPTLVEKIKDKFTKEFLREAHLPSDRSPVVRRHVHVGEGEDESGHFLCVTLSLTGSTYFNYDDDGLSVEDWVTEMAELQAENYQVEKYEYGFDELEEPKWSERAV